MALYCIKCEAGLEDSVSSALQEKLRAREPGAVACFPKKIMLEKHNKIRIKTVRPLMPGLVLVSADKDTVSALSGYSFLELDGDDVYFPLWVLGNKGVINPSWVEFGTTEPFKVLSGPMKVMPGNIKRVFKRDHRVVIEFPFMDKLASVTLSIDFDYVYDAPDKCVV